MGVRVSGTSRSHLLTSLVPGRERGSWDYGVCAVLPLTQERSCGLSQAQHSGLLLI